MNMCSCSMAMTKACSKCPNNINKFNEMKRNGELFYYEVGKNTKAEKIGNAYVLTTKTY